MTLDELKRYRDYKLEVDSLEKRMKELFAKATSAGGGGTTGGAKAKGKNGKEAIWATYADEAELYKEKVKELHMKTERIEYAISNLDSMDRNIMRRRYIFGETTEAIGDAVGYSERQVRRRIILSLQKLRNI